MATTHENTPRPPGAPRQNVEERPAKGGDKTTEEQLVADNAVEEDMIKALDPDNPSS